ncbi:MAG: hypothetical protein KDA33_02690 [Phycisphaerales bacterium]|nr:hypothetical protein [Phycisphaerales bacterium]
MTPMNELNAPSWTAPHACGGIAPFPGSVVIRDRRSDGNCSDALPIAGSCLQESGGANARTGNR